MPIIHFKPVAKKKNITDGIYACPLYYYPIRFLTLNHCERSLALNLVPPPPKMKYVFYVSLVSAFPPPEPVTCFCAEEVGHLPPKMKYAFLVSLVCALLLASSYVFLLSSQAAVQPVPVSVLALASTLAIA